MAAQSLSQKRIQERMQRHRQAVMVRAMQCARAAVKRQLQAQGHKLAQFSAKEIHLLAKEYFTNHSAELITKAKDDIATWPGFEPWRLPSANINNNAQKENGPESITSVVQMSGAK